MALSSTCFQLSLKTSCWAPAKTTDILHNIRRNQSASSALKTITLDHVSRQVWKRGTKHGNGWSFLGGSRVVLQPNHQNVPQRKSSRVSAMWLPSSQIASSVFTLGTAAVLPFYSLMVVAPKAELDTVLGKSAYKFRLRRLKYFLISKIYCNKGIVKYLMQTRKLMESTIPYVVFGLLYAYLLCLSWTPDTIRLMFASKYWLPELPGIAKMFSSEMTLASAWIHLLAVDLFAARHVYHDGLRNDIETRHSVSICLLFCPIGVVIHLLTKAVLSSTNKTEPRIL